MRINQLRTFHIYLDEEEALPYAMQTGEVQGWVTGIKVWVTQSGAAMVSFDGHFFDFLDLDVDPNLEDGDEGKVRPKRKRFSVMCDVAALRLMKGDPILDFLGKLNLMRQDEMSMAAFMSEEDPVG